MPNKDFKVKNKLQVAGITSAGPVVSDATGNLDSTPFVATQYGGTGTSTSPTSGQFLYSASGTNYAPTTLSSVITQQTPTDGASGTKTYVGTTTPSSPATGDIWIDSTAGSLPTLQRWSKTAAGGETSLSGIDDSNITLTYVVGTEQVYQNGVLLVRNADYTATNGTSISFTSALVAGDSVNILSFLGGSVADTYTQAQANSTFYPVTTTQIAGKNKFINGDFAINQRNFTSVTGNQGYAIFDRFRQGAAGDGTVTTSAQTFTLGSAPVAGYEGKNFLQIQTSGQTTAASYANFEQRIESVRTLAGQTATVSFWARATSGTPNIALEQIQYFGTGGSPSAFVTLTPIIFTLSTSWTRYSATISIPSISGKTIGTNNDDYLRFQWWVSAGADFNSRTNSLGIQNNTFQIWGVQLEAGSVATQFATASGTIGSELALCQRYYFRYTGGQAYSNYAIGNAYNGNTPSFLLKFPTTMRTIPTALEYSNLSCSDGVTGYAISSLSFNMNQVGVDFASISGTSASGLTQYRMYFINNNNNAAGYIGCSSEL